MSVQTAYVYGDTNHPNGRMQVSISLQLDGKDILKYVYLPRIDIISYDELEKLQAAIEKFIAYTLNTGASGGSDE